MFRILAINALSAGLVTLLTATHGGWPSLLISFLTSLIYANVIGSAAQILLPSVACRLEGLAPALYWLGLGATLFAVTVVGSLVSGALAGALGLFAAGSSWAVLRSGFRIALIITLSVGLTIALYERTRARLDHARESLRARELEMERAQQAERLLVEFADLLRASLDCTRRH